MNRVLRSVPISDETVTILVNHTVEEKEEEAFEDAATAEDTSASDFAASAEAPEMGFFAEFWDFLVHNKAWWLTPIILVLVLVFVLVWFAGTPFAPFIYGA